MVTVVVRFDLWHRNKAWGTISSCTITVYGYHIDSAFRYSVMQSDANSLCGDVVSDSFNKICRNEDNILKQIYKSKYVCLYYYFYDFNSYLIHTVTTVALKPNFMNSLFLCAVSLYMCIFFNYSFN